MVVTYSCSSVLREMKGVGKKELRKERKDIMAVGGGQSMNCFNRFSYDND